MKITFFSTLNQDPADRPCTTDVNMILVQCNSFCPKSELRRGGRSVNNVRILESFSSVEP